MGSLTHITDATFEQEIAGPVPVLVDFWAEWCGPCRMIAPVLEQLAVEQDGKLKIVKLNADENPATMRRFGVTGIPTLILFRDGKMVERVVGFRPKPDLWRALRPHVEAAQGEQTAAGTTAS